MNTCRWKRTANVRGFTVVELMVVLVIGAILVSVAVASYSAQVRKSRRTEAKTAVLDLAGREERNYSTTNTYTNVPANLGYTGDAFPIQIGNGYYSVDIAVTAAAGAVPATFTITATPVGDQLKDTQCASFSVNDQGVQSAPDDSGNDQTANCWR